ncbi:hypothetical protein B0H10DRAFT_2243824 [Mycena sp. CBHHK59/15]|nr:hypothetical protein B0H10DRAFT_2243824 [Mycena sp. CBHHK59/15]
MTVPTPLVTCPSAPMLVSHPRIALRFENATGSAFSAFYTHSSSHSPVPNQPPPSPPDKKRSHRCFVCGGTGKHRLNPRFCPRTWELANNGLVKFNIDGRLVSFDGSPLPMTRHPGGVAAHLLSPRRLTPRTIPVPPRRVHHIPTPSSRSYESDPPHTPSAVAVPTRHVPMFDRSFESNPPHILPEAAAPPRRVPSLYRTFIVNPPHVPPVMRIIPPSISTPIPRSTAVPKSNPGIKYQTSVGTRQGPKSPVETISYVNDKGGCHKRGTSWKKCEVLSDAGRRSDSGTDGGSGLGFSSCAAPFSTPSVQFRRRTEDRKDAD